MSRAPRPTGEAGSKEAKRLLERMRGRRILVLGDVMLDEFIWGKVVRISPEAPVPVVEVTRQSFHLGGAGNVAANIRSLGGECILTAVIGRDAAGERIASALGEAGVEASLAVSSSGRPTTVKTRIVAHHQQVVRADREQADDIPDSLEDEVLSRVGRALPRCEALVVSDYQKGVVTPRVMRSALALARKKEIPVLVDPKVRHFRFYKGVSLVTPNQLEAEQATSIRIRGTKDVEAAGKRILQLLSCRAVLVTRGEGGMSLFERGSPAVHIPTAAREVYDVTGAGDTVIATLGLGLASRASLRSAAFLANQAAGVVVGKLGTATITREELLRALFRAP